MPIGEIKAQSSKKGIMSWVKPDAPYQSGILYNSVFDSGRVNPTQPVRKPTSSTYQNPKREAN